MFRSFLKYKEIFTKSSVGFPMSGIYCVGVLTPFTSYGEVLSQTQHYMVPRCIRQLPLNCLFFRTQARFLVLSGYMPCIRKTTIAYFPHAMYRLAHQSGWPVPIHGSLNWATCLPVVWPLQLSLACIRNAPCTPLRPIYMLIKNL